MNLPSILELVRTHFAACGGEEIPPRKFGKAAKPHRSKPQKNPEKNIGSNHVLTERRKKNFLINSTKTMPKFEGAPNMNNAELNPNEIGADANGGKKPEGELKSEELKKSETEVGQGEEAKDSLKEGNAEQVTEEQVVGTISVASKMLIKKFLKQEDALLKMRRK